MPGAIARESLAVCRNIRRCWLFIRDRARLRCLRLRTRGYARRREALAGLYVECGSNDTFRLIHLPRKVKRYPNPSKVRYVLSDLSDGCVRLPAIACLQLVGQPTDGLSPTGHYGAQARARERVLQQAAGRASRRIPKVKLSLVFANEVVDDTHVCPLRSLKTDSKVWNRRIPRLALFVSGDETLIGGSRRPTGSSPCLGKRNLVAVVAHTEVPSDPPPELDTLSGNGPGQDREKEAQMAALLDT